MTDVLSHWRWSCVVQKYGKSTKPTIGKYGSYVNIIELLQYNDYNLQYSVYERNTIHVVILFKCQFYCMQSILAILLHIRQHCDGLTTFLHMVQDWDDWLRFDDNVF